MELRSVEGNKDRKSHKEPRRGRIFILAGSFFEANNFAASHGIVLGSREHKCTYIGSVGDSQRIRGFRFDNDRDTVIPVGTWYKRADLQDVLEQLRAIGWDGEA